MGDQDLITAHKPQWPGHAKVVINRHFLCDVTSHLHCPLSVSQLTSGEETPGREQLQTSHPTTGWQPNVWGSHWVHSGLRVLGGQMQSPVTGSHNLVPQLQAAVETAADRSLQARQNVSSTYACFFFCWKSIKNDLELEKLKKGNYSSANQRLTSAVGEPPVARGAHGTVSANYIWSAAALTTKCVAGVAFGSDLVTGAWHGAIVEEGWQRHGGA